MGLRDRESSRDRDRDRDPPSRGKSKGSGFKYRARSDESVKERAAQQRGMFDSIWKTGFKPLKIAEGLNVLRIMPPTWDNADHYAFPIHIHRNVGPDKATYLCLDKMKGEFCPLCDARRHLNQEDADVIRVQQQFVAWVIDRNAIKDGPKLWAMSWTMDHEFIDLSINKRRGTVMMIDHPDGGYDIEFERVGKGLKTKYSALKIDRDPSPLSDDQDKQDELLAYIQENPIPDVLNYYDADYIEGIFSGRNSRKGSARGDDDDEPPRRRSRSRDEDDDDEERPLKKTLRERVDEALDYDDIPETRGGPKRKARADDDDDDEPAPKARRKARTEEDDEDDEPAPKKKSGRVRLDEDEDDEPAPKKRRPVRAEEDDEDEEEVPKTKSKTRSRAPVEDDEEEPPPKKHRRAARDDDDDDDEPPKHEARRRDDNDDDEDDEPAPKKKRRAEPDDDDEDDDPPPKKKRQAEFDDDEIPSKPSRKPASRDDEGDDDEDEAPVNKVSAGAKSRLSNLKKGK